MGMINDDALLRLESNTWKHLHQLTFSVLEEEIVVDVFPILILKFVSIGTVTAKSLHLDHSNDSLWV